MTAKNDELLIKASAAVAISHNLSLAQQQLWNFLLKSAYHELNTKEEHKISMNQLRLYFGNTKNDEYIAQTLSGLSVKVHYNILGKDNQNKWGFLNLLDYAEVENGICTYAFSKKLRQLLHNPTFYTKINLLIQKKFYSKYALFLYELCIDYIGVRQTPWIALTKFRFFMGLAKEEYCQFKTLNSRIIKNSIKEINEKSDLFVEAKYVKENNKVTKVKFLVEQKPHVTLNELNSTENEQKISDEYYSRLKNLGISDDEIDEISAKYSEATIEEKISLLENNKTPIKNKGAWLISALKKDYKSFSYDKDKKEADKKQKIKEKQIVDQEKKELMEKLKQLHIQFKEELALSRYNALPTYMRTAFDINFQNWMKQKNKENSYFSLVSQSEAKKLFLNETLIEPHEKDFVQWSSTQGYQVKKIGNKHEFIN